MRPYGGAGGAGGADAACCVPTVVAALLLLWVCRDLPTRGFAADDFEWLLRISTPVTLPDLLRAAFDPLLAEHFYRPLQWLLLAGQHALAGTDARLYHVVSIGLHLANGLLLASLVVRFFPDKRGALIASCAGAWLLLHPAAYEAVVWISAQADLLLTLLLLLMLHLWLAGLRLLALVALALALLTKETAVVGVVLLALAGGSWRRLLPPALLTVVYLGLQLSILGQNTVVDTANYAFGLQMIRNPLVMLGTLVLPGTTPAVQGVVGVGVVIGMVIAGTLHAAGVGGGDAAGGRRITMRRYGSGARRGAGAAHHDAPVRGRRWRGARRGGGRSMLRPYGMLAVALLPTAPFLGTPDSRYMYLPVALAGLMLAHLLRRVPWLALGIAIVLMILGTPVYRAREVQFAKDSAPGGSLFALAQAECAAGRLNRMLIVDPPLAAGHAQAAVRLACGERPRPIVVTSTQIADELRTSSLVVAFVDGGARVVQRTAAPR